MELLCLHPPKRATGATQGFQRIAAACRQLNHCKFKPVKDARELRAVAGSEQRRPAGRHSGCAPGPPSSAQRSGAREPPPPRRPVWGRGDTPPAMGGRAAAERAPLLAGRAAAEGRGRRDWRGAQPRGAGPLYLRSPRRGAGSRAAGVRRRRGTREAG